MHKQTINPVAKIFLMAFLHLDSFMIVKRDIDDMAVSSLCPSVTHEIS